MLKFAVDRCVLILFIAVALTNPSIADEPQLLQHRVDAMSQQVERLLGIQLQQEVIGSRVGRDEFRKQSRGQLELVMPKERMNGAFRSFQLLGLLPAGDFDVYALFDLSLGLASAYYNPQTKSVHFLDNAAKATTDYVVFHELVHAVQDQEHDLLDIAKKLAAEGSTDGLLAFKVLFEGEAVFWARLHVRNLTPEAALALPPGSLTNLFGSPELMTSKTIVSSLKKRSKQNPKLRFTAFAMKFCPPLLVRALYLPYSCGDNTALRIFQRGGRRALRQAYADASALNTRDLLFDIEPKAVSRGITKIELADLQSEFGANWRLKHSDTIGSLVLHTMFERHIEPANKIAKSWEGDRIQVWENDGQRVLLGLVVFDSEATAKLFATELVALCRETWFQGKAICEHAASGTHLSADTDHLIVERRKRVVAFVRSRDFAGPAKIASSLWKSQFSRLIDSK